MQVVSSQHPIGHVVVLHEPPWHTPPLQVWPALVAHVWQKAPAWPHAVLVVPLVQSPELRSTHPLHAVHTPPVHVLPVAHAEQAAPP